MSIFITVLSLDGEDGALRPIRYQGNRWPLDEDDRSGSFDLAYICAHLAASARGEPVGDVPDDAPLEPYLRVGMSDGTDEDMSAGMDVMLDRRQVEEVRDALTWWLGEAAEEAKPKAAEGGAG